MNVREGLKEFLKGCTILVNRDSFDQIFVPIERHDDGDEVETVLSKIRGLD